MAKHPYSLDINEPEEKEEVDPFDNSDDARDWDRDKKEMEEQDDEN